MGTILIGLGCMLAGLLVGIRMRRLCPDCLRPMAQHCGDCIAVWEGVDKANRIHGDPTRLHSEWA